LKALRVLCEERKVEILASTRNVCRPLIGIAKVGRRLVVSVAGCDISLDSDDGLDAPGVALLQVFIGPTECAVVSQSESGLTQLGHPLCVALDSAAAI